MKEYQNGRSKVKGSVSIINQEKLLETASGGLLNLSIELGFEVLQQLLELDVTNLAGEKGKHNPNRTAYRHGKESTKVILGGEKRRVEKPRVRSTEGIELNLPTLTLFQNDEPLSHAVLAKLLRGVSTRKYEGTSENPSSDSLCTSKSEVSRRFIAGLENMVTEFLNRKLEDEYPVIMMDGMNIGSMTIIAAMGIKNNGEKQILGIIEGSSENHLVVNSLLADLIDRGLAVDIPRMFVLDGGKALHKSVTEIFGKYAAIQRCQVHKKRNVLSHLPKSELANVGLAISQAYLEFDYNKAKNALLLIADNLEYRYPAAANSLMEGLEETLTVHRLKVPALLRQSICTTNPMESANSVCMSIVRRIKNWKNGEMILRNITAGFMEAEKSFRRIKGYKQISILKASLRSSLKLEIIEKSEQSA